MLRLMSAVSRPTAGHTRGEGQGAPPHPTRRTRPAAPGPPYQARIMIPGPLHPARPAPPHPARRPSVLECCASAQMPTAQAGGGGRPTTHC
jgi:hypothetical protein